ncbi:MAG: hypothetical protein J2P48_16920 [Alphaproteobacteria bacterium]|nr:hypothetical protein [Alphaproteobacteria bacterium]
MTDDEKLGLIKRAVDQDSPLHPIDARFLLQKLEQAQTGTALLQSPRRKWIDAMLEWQAEMAEGNR